MCRTASKHRNDFIIDKTPESRQQSIFCGKAVSNTPHNINCSNFVISYRIDISGCSELLQRYTVISSFLPYNPHTKLHFSGYSGCIGQSQPTPLNVKTKAIFKSERGKLDPFLLPSSETDTKLMKRQRPSSDSSSHSMDPRLIRPTPSRINLIMEDQTSDFRNR